MTIISASDFSNMRSQVYECPRCKTKIKGEELELRNRIICPKCAYRVIQKIRPPVVKRLKCV